MVDLSIVVCTYNRSESLKDTLRALFGQKVSGALKIEILIVDNNSNDATRAVVESAMSRSPWPLRYLFEAQQGRSFAMNRAIRESSGSFIAFTDDDVLPEPTWIQSLWNSAQDFKADCVGGKVEPLWEQAPPTWLQNEKERQFALLALLDRGNEFQVAGKPDGSFLVGANMAFKKEIFNELGFFRTDVGRRGKQLLSGEDSDMIRRFIEKGKRVVYAPTAVVKHKVPVERMQLSYLRNWKFNSGRSIVRISKLRSGISFSLALECFVSGFAALSRYLMGQSLKAVGAEENFWKKFGMLTETLSFRQNA